MRAIAPLALLCATCRSSVLHVSPDGDDGSDGASPTSALRTVAAALHRLPAAEAGPAEIVLHGGVHGPARVAPKHTARRNERSRLTIRSAGGARRAIISGGVKVPASLFALHPTLPGVLVADLRALGLPEGLGAIEANEPNHECLNNRSELMFGGERMTLARYPNVRPNNGTFGFLQAATACGDGCFGLAAGPDAERALARWGMRDGLATWLHGYWAWDWADSYRELVSVVREPNGSATLRWALAPDKGANVDVVKPNARFYALNSVAELDAPGEYALLPNRTLLFYPPSPLESWDDDDAPTLSLADVALDLSETAFVTVAGVGVRNARSVGVLALGVTRVRLDNLSVSAIGGDGIVLSGDSCEVTRCDVASTGCAGVRASGGDALALAPGNLTVRGNAVRAPAQWKRTYQPAILWGGAGNRYVGNRLSASPHVCFLGGGNEARSTGALGAAAALAAVDNVFEGNALDTCAFETSDAGAFYTSGQEGTAWVNRGNVLRNNTFVRVRNAEGGGVQPGNVHAVYLDDQVSGWAVTDNVFVDVHVGVLLGGGRDVRVERNYFERVDAFAVNIDERGVVISGQNANCNCTCGGESTGCAPFNTTCDPAGATYVLASTNGSAWAARWPELATATTARPCVPFNNTIADNIFCDAASFISKNESQICSWNSTISNNTNMTQPCRYPER